MKPLAYVLASAGAALLTVAVTGCGASSDSRGNDAAATTSATPTKREIPQPPSNLTFAYGFADTTCGGQGLTFEHYGVEREVFVCMGSELPELKGKAVCFVGQPSADATGANMVGQYDIQAKAVAAGGSWPRPCATTFASMLQWYYHRERGTLRQTSPEPSTNPAPAEAPPGRSGVLQVRRNGSLTCYSTSQRYTFPDGETALVGICESADGSQTCASYQQSSGRIVTLGFPDSPWQPECLAARRMVENYKSGESETQNATTEPAEDSQAGAEVSCTGNPRQAAVAALSASDSDQRRVLKFGENEIGAICGDFTGDGVADLIVTIGGGSGGPTGWVAFQSRGSAWRLVADVSGEPGYRLRFDGNDVVEEHKVCSDDYLLMTGIRKQRFRWDGTRLSPVGKPIVSKLETPTTC